jgi:hypothetical protein
MRKNTETPSRHDTQHERLIRWRCDATDIVSVLQGHDHRHPGQGNHRDDILAVPRMRADVDDPESESLFNARTVRSRSYGFGRVA